MSLRHLTFRAWLLFGLGFGVILVLLVVLFTRLLAPPEQARFVLPEPPLNPAHGIHAPVGFRWSDYDRRALNAFADRDGFARAPGSILALSSDMKAADNDAGVQMERDLFEYQAKGTEIYVRMYPQRFPGGLTDPLEASRNTISGTPQDAVDDIFRFLQEQQTRTGRHFTRIIPGNEMNIEWPNQNYYYNLLRWNSDNDPLKFDAINAYMLEIYATWETRLAQPEAAPLRDVRLYFPALSQDGDPVYYGGSFFYDNNRPIANKYDRLQAAIERFGHFTWHNYWRPGQVWQDRAIVHFPEWLKTGILSGGLPSAITESGWSPSALRIPIPPEQVFLENLRTAPPLNHPLPSHMYNQDDQVNNVLFEDDVRQFVLRASGAAYDQPNSAPAVMIWLTGSSGAFGEAVGVTTKGEIRRWLRYYAALPL